MNSVFLIGCLTCWPGLVGPHGEPGFEVLTLRDPEGHRVDRHRVIVETAHASDLTGFTPGATVYVEGRLGRDGDKRRVSVLARRTWVLEPAYPPVAAPSRVGTHASPREHLRAGHPRRLAANTAAERVIWVGPTTVRPRSPAAAPPPYSP